MRAKDVRECVDIVARHPVLAPRYGDTIRDLKAAWLGVLGREAFRAVVFEGSPQSGNGIIGTGISAFVSDEFLRELKKPPFFWVGPELTKLILRGESPLLSDRGVREANAKGGLNLIVWEGVLRPEFWGYAEAHDAVISAFVEQHRGFLLKELLAQPSTREALEITLRSGSQLLHKDGRYFDFGNRSLDEIFKGPHYVGLTRNVALSRPGAWAGSLFVNQAPQCGFRPSEQRLLLAALRGGTDRELAEEIGISLPAVKKTWLSIYGRVSKQLPLIFPNGVAIPEDGERGREKKQHLIAYLRDHPEELRPACP